MSEITAVDPATLPDVVMTKEQKVAVIQLATLKNVQHIIKVSGLEPRLNMATATTHYFINGVAMDDDPAVQEHGELMLLDLCTYCGIKQQDQIRGIITNLAKFKAYHPMEDWLRGLEWDGVDRLDDLAASIKTNEPLWDTYLENWLVQVVEGVCGWHGKAKASLPHVLVLVGGQGTGKSYWLKQLGGAWFKGEAELHLSSTVGKDHQIEALKFPMVELAELDGIFRKSDVSHMKAFISREVDAIRAPYERRALIRPRLTSFCGSVNDAEFLNDPSGSRRFWPVMVASISWKFSMDWSQLWAQAFSFWVDNPAFNLTAEEDAIREATALEQHFMESDEAETVREYLRMHSRNKTYPVIAMSTLDVLRMLYGKQRSFNNKQKADAGRALRDISGAHRTIDGKQRSWLLPFNEFATDRALWPDKISLI